MTLGAETRDRPRVLLLTKSSGFEHSVIQRRDSQPSHVETVLASLAEQAGWELVATKDASLVERERLATFDAVIFYTTGDLTTAGSGKGLFGGDGSPPMKPDGVAALRAWVEAGGGFLGFHSATDTFHGENNEVTPYLDLIGGEFRIHGLQFEATVRVVDGEHPAMAGTPVELRRTDEWYLFRNLDTEHLHVLAVMDPGDEGSRQKLYAVAPYPVIWTKAVGKGRVYYNAMGHREDVWSDPVFQESVVAAIRWALGEGATASAPNYHEVIGEGE